jgi:hypothetical protein
MGYAPVSPSGAAITSLVSWLIIPSIHIVRLSFIYAESIFYSPTSDQCLTSGLRAMKDPAYGITLVMTPMVFDILLLTLTFIKALKSAPLGSHNRSPIVCVVFHCGLYLEPIEPPRCER